MRRALAVPAGLVALAIVLSGCSGVDLLAYDGGGLPPGDGDVGGIVLAAVETAATDGGVESSATSEVPVVGAEVVLYRGNTEVGRTQTGEGGYFRFTRPGTGQYAVEVTPPAGSPLLQARREFRHQSGIQTFLTIVLEAASS